MRLPSLFQKPFWWYLAFAIWFVVLWNLSSGPLNTPPIKTPFPTDKILHFGYFFGGGGLLSAAFFFHRPDAQTGTRILIALTILFLVGALDEWHQTFSEHRSGNDAADLTADFLGSLVGALTFYACRRWVFTEPFQKSL